MAKVVAENEQHEIVLMDEGALAWKLWREDVGESWTVVHELRDANDRVVRRDSWVIYKATPVPIGEIQQGDVNG